MGSFSASLKTIGDNQGLPATVRLDEGRLAIAAGDADIGSWSLDEIGLEPTSRGYRLAAEGEQLLIELDEIEQFADELSKAQKKTTKRNGFRLPLRGKSSDRPSDDGGQAPEPQQAVVEEPRVAEPARPRVRLPEPVRAVDEAPAETEKKKPARRAKKEKAPKAEKTGDRSAVAMLDRTIDSVEKRWGSLLPDWVFNRIVFVGAGVLVILAFVFRGYTSIVLLVTGVIALMVGGAAYTDDVMASKLLPGRTTPTHVLLVGIGFVAVGIGFGFIA